MGEKNQGSFVHNPGAKPDELPQPPREDGPPSEVAEGDSDKAPPKKDVRCAYQHRSALNARYDVI